MKLQELLAVLIMHRHNLQMIHWNVVGRHFQGVHTTLDAYVGQVTTDIDKVAEYMKMLDVHATIPSFLELPEIVKQDSKNHIAVTGNHVDADTAWQTVKAIFDDIIQCMQDVYKDMPSDIQSELDTSIHYYRLEGSYKCAATVAANKPHED